MNVPPHITSKGSSHDSNETLKLTLYIVGGALNSLRALANLEAICNEYFPNRYQLEVVDIFEDPLRALADKVLVTPTLTKTAPAPSIRLIGDLSQTETVVLALQSTGRNA